MKRRRAGFTLFEIVLALAMLLALSGALVAVTWNIARLSASTEERSARETAVADLFHRLEAAAAGAHATSFAGGAGWTGDAGTLGVNMTGIGDLPRVIEVTFSPERGHLELRDVQFGSVSPGEGPAALRIEGVSRVRFSYFVAGRWISSIPADAAPAAILVAVWFGAPAGPDAAQVPESPPDRARVIALFDVPLGEGP